MRNHDDIHTRLTGIETGLDNVLSSIIVLIDGLQREMESNEKLISATMTLIHGHGRALDHLNRWLATVQDGPRQEPRVPSTTGSADPRPVQKGDDRDDLDDTTRARQGATRVCEHDTGETT